MIKIHHHSLNLARASRPKEYIEDVKAAAQNDNGVTFELSVEDYTHIRNKYIEYHKKNPLPSPCPGCVKKLTDAMKM